MGDFQHGIELAMLRLRDCMDMRLNDTQTRCPGKCLQLMGLATVLKDHTIFNKAMNFLSQLLVSEAHCRPVEDDEVILVNLPNKLNGIAAQFLQQADQFSLYILKDPRGLNL